MQLVGSSKKMEEQNLSSLSICGVFTVGYSPGTVKSIFRYSNRSSFLK